VAASSSLAAAEAATRDSAMDGTGEGRAERAAEWEGEAAALTTVERGEPWALRFPPANRNASDSMAADTGDATAPDADRAGVPAGVETSEDCS
jgi:hypothetical protein